MKSIAATVIICLGSFKASAALYASKQDSLKKTTLTVAALYSNNVNYYGQVTAEKLPYVLANATARFSSGIYLSAGTYKLLSIGSGISETDLGIGYDYEVSKKLTVSVGYSRSFFPSNSPLLQAANENNLSINADYLWPWFKTKISADYAFGKAEDAFFSLNNSKSIDIGQLIDNKDLVSIEPAIEIVAGTQHYFETYTIEKNKRNKGKGNAPINLPGNGNKPIITTTTIPTTSFNLLSYNFKLPISYSRSHFMGELSYQFSILGKNAQTEANKQQHFIGIGLYYQF